MYSRVISYGALLASAAPSHINKVYVVPSVLQLADNSLASEIYEDAEEESGDEDASKD